MESLQVPLKLLERKLTHFVDLRRTFERNVTLKHVLSQQYNVWLVNTRTK